MDCFTKMLLLITEVMDIVEILSEYQFSFLRNHSEDLLRNICGPTDNPNRYIFLHINYFEIKVSVKSLFKKFIIRLLAYKLCVFFLVFIPILLIYFKLNFFQPFLLMQSMLFISILLQHILFYYGFIFQTSGSNFFSSLS